MTLSKAKKEEYRQKRIFRHDRNQEILRLRKLGYSKRALSKMFNLDRATIRYILKSLGFYY